MNRRVLIAALTLLLVSCGSSKDIAYFQDIDSATAQIAKTECVVRTGDILSITVSSSKPELAAAYNLMGARNQIQGVSQAVVRTTPQNEVLGYTVDRGGEIDFPVIGKVEVGGKSRNRVELELKERLREALPDVVVTVSILNFNITVIGEVNRPGTFNITGDRITVLEALAMAGDLTVYGKRADVIVIRETGGERQVEKIDLKSKSLFDSPFYYLQQNDVIYIEPNSARAKSVSSFNTYFPAITSLASLATSLAMIIYYLGYGR